MTCLHFFTIVHLQESIVLDTRHTTIEIFETDITNINYSPLKARYIGVLTVFKLNLNICIYYYCVICIPILSA